MRWAFPIFLAAGMWAQSLQILPSPPSPAGSSFRIMLASPEGKTPVALQWNLSLPEGVTLKETASGEASESAQKTVQCAAAASGAGSEYRCLVVGGAKPIPDGAVAVIRCTLGKGLREATVRVTHIVGVTQDSKRVDMADTQATIRGQ